jgi:hypothetical protein
MIPAIVSNQGSIGLFDVSLGDEIALALDECGLTRKEVVQYQQNVKTFVCVVKFISPPR